jgi:hypothetical protein
MTDHNRSHEMDGYVIISIYLYGILLAHKQGFDWPYKGSNAAQLCHAFLNMLQLNMYKL